jgi:hypothetical protein
MNTRIIMLVVWTWFALAVVLQPAATWAAADDPAAAALAEAVQDGQKLAGMSFDQVMDLQADLAKQGAKEAQTATLVAAWVQAGGSWQVCKAEQLVALVKHLAAGKVEGCERAAWQVVERLADA